MLRQAAILSCCVAFLAATASTAEAHWYRTPYQIHKIKNMKWKIKAYQLNIAHAQGVITYFKYHKSFESTTSLRDHRYVIRRSNAAVIRLRAKMHPFVDSCLDQLLRREGGYNPHKWNGGYVGPWEPFNTHGGSGAYGGPQALPGDKMKSAGVDWRDNIWTQIRWMKGYVTKYGGSCAALAFQTANGFY